MTCHVTWYQIFQEGFNLPWIILCILLGEDFVPMTGQSTFNTTIPIETVFMCCLVDWNRCVVDSVTDVSMSGHCVPGDMRTPSTWWPFLFCGPPVAIGLLITMSQTHYTYNREPKKGKYQPMSGSLVDG